MKLAVKTLVAASMLAMAAGTTAAADKPATIKAVGTWGSLTNYQKHEGPFWNDKIAEASGERSGLASYEYLSS